MEKEEEIAHNTYSYLSMGERNGVLVDWDQWRTYARAFKASDWDRCSQLLLQWAVANPDKDLSIFNTTLGELAEAAGHIGLLCWPNGVVAARTMYDPEDFGPGNYRGYAEVYDKSGEQLEEHRYFGGATEEEILDGPDYPIGTRFMNNTNGKLIEVTELDGISDYGLQVVGAPRDKKNFVWMSEGEVDQMLKRGAFSSVDPAEEDEDEDGPASRNAEPNAGHGEFIFLFNGWNVNVTRSELQQSTKSHKYYEFVAYRDGAAVAGEVKAEYDRPSEEWQIEEVTFDGGEEEEVQMLEGSDTEDLYEQFAEGIDLYS